MPSVATDAQSVAARSKLWRVTDRTTFAALRRQGRRARVGALSVTWLPPERSAPAGPPRAAFTVGRSAGGAVVRNRIRRRLRAALRELQRTDGLPAGTYLLGASADVAHLAWADLLRDLGSAVGTVTADAP
jgi:ribonuclease P protein component